MQKINLDLKKSNLENHSIVETSNTIDRTVVVVSAFVSNNATTAQNLTDLIEDTYKTLQRLEDLSAQGFQEEKEPAVPIKKISN